MDRDVLAKNVVEQLRRYVLIQVPRIIIINKVYTVDEYVDVVPSRSNERVFIFLRLVLFIPFIILLTSLIYRRFQHYLDKTVIYPQYRWPALGLLLIIYALRVWSLSGWYIVTYGLSIYLLNLFIGFITPQVSLYTMLLVVSDG
jgi:hypothetical protein